MWSWACCCWVFGFVLFFYFLPLKNENPCMHSGLLWKQLVSQQNGRLIFLRSVCEKKCPAQDFPSPYQAFCVWLLTERTSGLFCQTASWKSNTLPRLVGFHGNYRAGRWLEQVRWLVFTLSLSAASETKRRRILLHQTTFTEVWRTAVNLGDDQKEVRAIPKTFNTFCLFIIKIF